MPQLHELFTGLRKDINLHFARRQSAKEAKDAIISIAQKEQTPIHTYLKEDDYTFHLPKQQPGTIFRIESDIKNFYGNHDYVRPIWLWFVVGNTIDTLPSVYLVSHRDPAEQKYSIGPQLSAGKSLRLIALGLSDRPQGFTVYESCTVLLRGTVYKPWIADMLDPARLDVMSAGHKKRENDRVSSFALPKLTEKPISI